MWFCWKDYITGHIRLCALSYIYIYVYNWYLYKYTAYVQRDPTLYNKNSNNRAQFSNYFQV